MHRSLVTLACLLACLALAPLDVRAQAPSRQAEQSRQLQAQAHFQHGIELAQGGEAAAAREAFLGSLALWPHASTYFNLALVELALGHGRRALHALAEFDEKAESGRHDEFLAAAGSLRARALGMTGTLELTLSPESAELRVDDEPFEPGRGARRTLRLDAGPHKLEARAKSHLTASIELHIVRGLTHAYELSLVPAPVVLATTSTRRPADRTPSWVRRRATWLWAGAAVLLAGGLVAMGLALRPSGPGRAALYAGSHESVF